MKNTKKNLILGLMLSTIACASVATVSLVSYEAYAETPDVSTVVGASVRKTTDYSGIRFTGFVSNEYFTEGVLNENVVAGMLVTEGEVEANVLTHAANEEGALEDQVLDIKALVWDDAKSTEYAKAFNAVVYDIPKVAYGMTLTARAYVGVYNAETQTYSYTYAEEVASRNIAQVASIALAEGETDPDNVIRDYVDGVEGDFTVDGKADETIDVALTVGDKLTVVAVPSYLQVALTSADAEKVSVENGEITAVAATSDPVVVTAKLGSLTKVINVSVANAAPSFVLLNEGKAIDMDMSLTSSSITMPENHGVTSAATVTIGEKAVAFAVNGNTISFTGTDLNALKLEGPQEVVIASESVAYKANVILITKIVYTWQDLHAMMNMLNDNAVAHEHTDDQETLTLYSYGGYFTLGANIDYGGDLFDMNSRWHKTAGLRIRYNAGSNFLNYSATPDCGFTGTLDGRGYTIKELKVKTWFTYGDKVVRGSLLGQIARTGVVKNLGITGRIDNTCSDGALLAYASYGTIENVYMEGYPGTSSGTAYRGAGALINVMVGGTLKNIVTRTADCTGSQNNGYVVAFFAGLTGNGTDFYEGYTPTLDNIYVRRRRSGYVSSGGWMSGNAIPNTDAVFAQYATNSVACTTEAEFAAFWDGKTLEGTGFNQYWAMKSYDTGYAPIPMWNSL